MLNLESIQETNPQFFNKKKINLVATRGKGSALPVSHNTLHKVTIAIINGEWLTYTEIGKITGFSSGTVSRAARHLKKEGKAIIKVDENGQARSSYLKLV